MEVLVGREGRAMVPATTTRRLRELRRKAMLVVTAAWPVAVPLYTAPKVPLLILYHYQYLLWLFSILINQSHSPVNLNHTCLIPIT